MRRTLRVVSATFLLIGLLVPATAIATSVPVTQLGPPRCCV